MKKRKKLSKPATGQVIGAILFISLLVGLVMFAAGYNADGNFSSSFFDDVSNAVQWR